MDEMDKELQAIPADREIYEVGFHIIPNVGDDHLGKEVTEVRDIIERHKGSVFADEYPKHLELTYPMVKVVANRRTTYRSAYFGWMKFEAVASAAPLIEADLKKDNAVLRFLLIKTVRENTLVPKKVYMQKRDETTRGTDKDAPKVTMTEEEIDKTIEELVVS